MNFFHHAVQKDNGGTKVKKEHLNLLSHQGVQLILIGIVGMNTLFMCMCFSQDYKANVEEYSDLFGQCVQEYISVQENSYEEELQYYLSIFEKKSVLKEMERLREKLLARERNGFLIYREGRALFQLINMKSAQQDSRFIGIRVEQLDGTLFEFGEQLKVNDWNMRWSLCDLGEYSTIYSGDHRYLILRIPLRDANKNITGYFYGFIEGIHTFESVKEKYTDLPIQLCYIYHARTMETVYQARNLSERSREERLKLVARAIQNDTYIAKNRSYFPLYSGESNIQERYQSYFGYGKSTNYVYVAGISEGYFRNQMIGEAFYARKVQWCYQGVVNCLLLWIVYYSRLCRGKKENALIRLSKSVDKNWNLKDEMLGIGNRDKYYRDMDLLMCSEGVRQITLIFLDIVQFELFSYENSILESEAALKKF